ncbi:KEOPS complex subunit Cgi121 [Candidatus Methanomassiliicoccus intestinalis]|uniref:KEOPS complex subunit Cgi121 n=1 Tax=Candidatus Methanomassiliicoccus intestinalis TaxID=1406512 RepID=UPI0037DD5ED7
MAEVTVIGATGSFEIEDFKMKLQEMGVLGIDPEMVCGKDHLISAADCAVRAFSSNRNVCSTLAMETMLYASGEHQILKAADKMGIKSNNAVALVIFDMKMEEVLSKLNLKQDDSLLEPSEEKMMRFGIDESEMHSVPDNKKYDLILEHVAFAALKK